MLVFVKLRSRSKSGEGQEGQIGLQGGPQGVLQGVHHGVVSFQMDSGSGNIGQEWSGVVSAEV